MLMHTVIQSEAVTINWCFTRQMSYCKDNNHILIPAPVTCLMEICCVTHTVQNSLYITYITKFALDEI